MGGDLKSLILFDADTQHYRQSIYKYFHREFKKIGYELKVYYDKNLNQVEGDIFEGINYTFGNFCRAIKKHHCRLIILFVWLRYKFLLPFMLWNRIRGIKMITWSHGINLMKKNNKVMNRFYYLRQRLAHALIIYSKNEKKYIKASHKKLYIANNTLNFYDFPKIKKSPEKLKEQFRLKGKKIVLCVGRMNVNKRNLDDLLSAFENPSLADAVLAVVGPGITDTQIKKMERQKNITYFGAVFDTVKINEIYKMSDLFCMPGAIGLAINHAFYYGLPVVVANIDQVPEAGYLKEGRNGFFFKAGDIKDLTEKITRLLSDDSLREKFSNEAVQTIRTEASMEKMLEGFYGAIQHVTS